MSALDLASHFRVQYLAGLLPGVALAHAFVGEAAGSDHRAFVADVRVPRAPARPGR